MEKHDLGTYPNLAKDTFIDIIDKFWCADITYICILTGFVYLAAIIDAFSREIVGYAIGKPLRRISHGGFEKGNKVKKYN